MARRDIDRLQGEIEELFADLWQVPRFAGLAARLPPAVDCFLTEDPPQLAVVVELAGVDPDSIELVGRGARADDLRQSRRGRALPGQVYQQTEIEYGRFERRIPLEQDIDAAAATRRYEAGCSGSPSRSPSGTRRAGRRHRRAQDADERDRLRPPAAAGPAAEGDRRLPGVDDAARGRPGALGQADRRRRLGRADARALHRQERGRRAAGLGRPLPGRHRRGRPQDDQGARRDAADPRPGPRARPARRAPSRTTRTSSPSSRSCRTIVPGLARGRGADPERAEPVRADHRADAVPARGAAARRRERRRPERALPPGRLDAAPEDGGAAGAARDGRRRGAAAPDRGDPRPRARDVGARLEDPVAGRQRRSTRASASTSSASS